MLYTHQYYYVANLSITKILPPPQKKFKLYYYVACVHKIGCYFVSMQRLLNVKNEVINLHFAKLYNEV